MSEWTPPSSSDFPGQPTDGIDALLRKVERTKRELDDATNNLLKAAGISVGPEGLTIDSELLVTGATRIEGTLSLPAGIIDNDALANPIIFDGTWNEADNFAIPTTATEIVSASFVVPAGFTRMKFEAIGSAQVGNTSAGTQYIYLRPRRKTNGVITNGGIRQLVLLPAGGWDSVVAPYMFTDDVVPGDTITFTLEAYASATALAAHASNTTRLEVAITLAR